jgi:hypothetical protein
MSRMFLPGVTTAASIVSAVSTLNALNELTKLKDVVDRHAQGRQRERVRKPTESQCASVCAGCLEQCPEAQADEDILGMLFYINKAQGHIHHGVLYTE